MKPTSILGRYLIKQILINFIAVLLMVTGVILMFEIIELLRRTADRPDVDMIFVMKMAFSKVRSSLALSQTKSALPAFQSGDF